MNPDALLENGPALERSNPGAGPLPFGEGRMIDPVPAPARLAEPDAMGKGAIPSLAAINFAGGESRSSEPRRRIA